jgi:hypothetical protein
MHDGTQFTDDLYNTDTCDLCELENTNCWAVDVHDTSDNTLTVEAAADDLKERLGE